MSMKPQLSEFQNRLLQAVANGLNRANEALLEDVKGHVCIRSSALHDSYVITQIATPQRLTAAVDSPLNYRLYQYPNQPRIRLAGSPKPALFGPQAKGGEFEALSRQSVEDAIAQEFEGE